LSHDHPAALPESPTATPIFSRDKVGLTVTVVLLSASAVAWGLTFYLMPLMMSSGMSAMGAAALVSSLSPASVGLFELIWVIGMTAMMFPAMIPVVVFYDRIATKVEANPATARAIGTPLFLLGYLTTYAALGLFVYLAVYLAVTYAAALPAALAVAGVAPALVLVLAGLYQLSPLKSTCLSHCVSPLGFFAAHSRRGLLGSLRMGLSHGNYCVGCCWAYMLVMAAVAVMSLPFMLVLAAVIALEKVIIRGAVWFTRAVAAAFIILGVVSFFFPSVLGLLSAGL
jgi:predicted metal-binding membrane protein